MLKIFNDLAPFFENNYRRVNVREYARIRKVSPPTASKMLLELKKEGLLEQEKEKNYQYYLANRKSKQMIGLSRIYWQLKLESSGLLDYLEQQFINPLVILFGSFSKLEVKPDSDIDIAVFSASAGKKTALDIFERKLKRKIQLFAYSSKEAVKNKDLLKNIMNGFILSGRW